MFRCTDRLRVARQTLKHTKVCLCPHARITRIYSDVANEHDLKKESHSSPVRFLLNGRRPLHISKERYDTAARC